MEMTKLRIIQTAVVVASYILLRIIAHKVIDKNTTNKVIQKTRGKIIKKAFNFTLLSIGISIILIVWGVDQSELAVFIGSVLTVIGIVLFAQWSILSNITSSIIIFFSHSVKLDDTIAIIDKDFEVEGRVRDISLFFVTLKTPEGEEVSIPNNVFIQKMIKKKNK